MNTTRKNNWYVGLVLVLVLLLWSPLPASSFPQNGGGAAGAGDEGKADGIAMQTVSGNVVETMNSGGYTYAVVKDEKGGKTWVALPQSQIAVGNEISCKPGMVMSNFTSPSLNRTFRHIVFSGGITSLTQGTADPEAAPAPEETPPLPKIKEPENWKDF